MKPVKGALYRTISPKPGVKIRLMKNPAGKMVVQSYLLAKDKYDEKKIPAWIQKYKLNALKVT